LKFTGNGGYVKIKGKVLSHESSLSYPEEKNFVEIVKNSKHGVLEIIVEDSGVGIK